MKCSTNNLCYCAWGVQSSLAVKRWTSYSSSQNWALSNKRLQREQNNPLCRAEAWSPGYEHRTSGRGESTWRGCQIWYTCQTGKTWLVSGLQWLRLLVSKQHNIAYEATNSVFDSLHAKHITCVLHALLVHNTLSSSYLGLKKQGRVLLTSTFSDWLCFFEFYGRKTIFGGMVDQF